MTADSPQIEILRVDGRTSGAKRLRDLRAAFAEECGSEFDALPASGRETVAQLARITFELEIMEAQRSRGEAIDAVSFVSLVNAQRRALRDLRGIKALQDDAR